MTVIISAELIGELAGSGCHDRRVDVVISSFTIARLSEAALSADFVDPNEALKRVTVDWLDTLRQCLRSCYAVLRVAVFSRIKDECLDSKIGSESPFKESCEGLRPEMHLRLSRGPIFCTFNCSLLQRGCFRSSR